MLWVKTKLVHVVCFQVNYTTFNTTLRQFLEKGK